MNIYKGSSYFLGFFCGYYTLLATLLFPTSRVPNKFSLYNQSSCAYLEARRMHCNFLVTLLRKKKTKLRIRPFYSDFQGNNP
jgi:hypothetical protein